MELYRFFDVRFKQVLNIPALTLQKGGVTTLFGPSGSGKTTILRLLNKMLSPSAGRITFEGEDLAGMDSVELRRGVSMLSQTPTLFEGTVRDNLLAGLRFQERRPPSDITLGEVLAKVHLSQKLQDGTAHLSGGEKQRLALARILLLDSPVYLLDEPSSALDEETAGAIVEMLADEAKAKGKTLIMVTHAAEIAEKHSDRIVYIEAGRVLREEEKR